VKILSVDYDALIKSIERVCEGIRENYSHVKKILLFGSFYKGNYTPESDIDILIEVKHTDVPFMERRDLFADFFENIPFDINMLVYTEDELNSMIEKGNLFVKEVLSESLEL
jgi:predicted nucleotidyltransferase